MGATVTTDPLTFSCVFSDGKRATFALDGLACPELARDLLTGLAGLVHPHGSADAAGTVDLYVLALKNMVKTLAGRGFTGGARQLTRVQLAEYWMGATVSREACTRRMLQAFHAATAGLAAGAGELAAGRAYNPQANRRPLPAYHDSEWGRLIETCRALTGESYAAHKRALASASRGRDPREGGWTADNLRWLLARTGPQTLADVCKYAAIAPATARRRGGLARVSAELFPPLEVTAGYVLLFGAYSGIVPDGIGDLVVDDVDWAGDGAILLSYVRGCPAGTVAGAFGAAALPHPARPAPAAVAGDHPGRFGAGIGRAGAPQRDPPVGPPPRRDRRRRDTAEDPPAPDPHHPPRNA